jgi:hypothetical protein
MLPQVCSNGWARLFNYCIQDGSHIVFICAFEAEDVETNAKYSGFSYSLNALFVAKNVIEP